MDAALRAASDQLMRDARPGRARSIVYIGDGMSTAQLLFSERLRELMDRFVDGRISINSYAIGPRVDHHLLGALAILSGVMLLIVRDDWSGDQFGRRLADVAQASVAWPTATQL